MSGKAAKHFRALLCIPFLTFSSFGLSFFHKSPLKALFLRKCISFPSFKWGGANFSPVTMSVVQSNTHYKMSVWNILGVTLSCAGTLHTGWSCCYLKSTYQCVCFLSSAVACRPIVMEMITAVNTAAWIQLLVWLLRLQMCTCAATPAQLLLRRRSSSIRNFCTLGSEVCLFSLFDQKFCHALSWSAYYMLRC